MVQRDAQVWQARTDSLLREAKQAHKASVDSARGAAQALQTTAAQATARGRAAKQKADAFAGYASTLLDSLKTPTTTPTDSLAVAVQVIAQMRVTEYHLRDVIMEQEEAIESLEGAIEELEGALTLAYERIDVLEAQLASAPKPSGCKILGFIPCPSRTTAALAGVVVGVALTGGAP